MLIKFRQNWSKQEVKHYVLRSTNLIIPFGIRNNCDSSRYNLSYHCTYLQKGW